MSKTTRAAREAAIDAHNARLEEAAALAWHLAPEMTCPNGHALTCRDCVDVITAQLAHPEENTMSPSTRDIIAQANADAMQVLRDDSDSSARLRAYLVLKGHRQWPKGKELEEPAAEIGVSRPVAFRAKRAGGLLP